MILTKTTEYAVRVLAYMAKEKDQLLSAKYLHEQLSIPYKYLTRLMTDLAKSGYLMSVKGRDGGFRIIKDLKEISLANIVETVEGMDSFNACILGFHECSSENPCAMHFVWEENKKQLLKTLKTTSLDDLSRSNIGKY
jgi:Rrf2 family protein